ncbi:hypothetical protein ACEQPO_21915 [Bacillus sp. SL00103]
MSFSLEGLWDATLIHFLFSMLLIGFTPKKQGVHDYFADAVVVHEHL